MFKTRVLTALIGIPIVLAIIYWGGIYTKLSLGIIGIIALYEYFQMLKTGGYRPLLAPAYVLLILMIFSNSNHYLHICLYFLVLLTVISVIIPYPYFKITDIALSLFMPLYLGFLLNFGILIADNIHHFKILLLCFLLTWGNDTGGYLFGSWFGKNKLAPLLSPKKTWEGALGGVFIAALLAVSFIYFFYHDIYSVLYLIILIIISSIAAQMGDLFISLIKRYFGVKDSGHIIPGHGGVLDRFDSFFLVLPVVYFFIDIIGI